VAVALAVTQTTAMDATQGPPTSANLVAALETTEAPPSSPPLEGETPLQHFCPQKWGHKGSGRATTRTHMLPTPLISQAHSRSRGCTGQSRRKLRQWRFLSGILRASGAAEEQPLRRGENLWPERRRRKGVGRQRRLLKRCRRLGNHRARTRGTDVGDDWRVVDDNYGQAVGKLQAESMMSTPASLFP
jgi:hypothetical protein